MTTRMFKQNGLADRSSLASRIGLVSHIAMATFMVVSCPAVLFAVPVDEAGNSMRGLCELSGGTFTESGDGTQTCCWTDWGCLECNSFNDSNCLMECDTAACCDANSGCNVVQGPDGPMIADPGDEPDRSEFDLLDPDDSPAAFDDSGQYTPIGDLVGLFVDVGPDLQRADLESVDVAGTLNELCGAVGGGSITFGMIGFAGLVSTHRRRRN